MSSKVKVFIAPSLDGFIADENDSVDFLTNTPQVEGAGDYGYTEFFSKIEAVLMGTFLQTMKIFIYNVKFCFEIRFAEFRGRRNASPGLSIVLGHHSQL